MTTRRMDRHPGQAVRRAPGFCRSSRDFGTDFQFSYLICTQYRYVSISMVVNSVIYEVQYYHDKETGETKWGDPFPLLDAVYDITVPSFF